MSIDLLGILAVEKAHVEALTLLCTAKGRAEINVFAVRKLDHAIRREDRTMKGGVEMNFPYTSQDLHPDELQSLAADLQLRADRAYTAYACTKSQLPGEQWSHVTEPLERTWRETEHALALVRSEL